jgi:hypothetical protein
MCVSSSLHNFNRFDLGNACPDYLNDVTIKYSSNICPKQKIHWDDLMLPEVLTDPSVWATLGRDESSRTEIHEIVYLWISREYKMITNLFADLVRNRRPERMAARASSFGLLSFVRGLIAVSALGRSANRRCRRNIGPHIIRTKSRTNCEP